MPMEISHIWLAVFPSETAFDEYFAESYSEDDESPINAFARDQGQNYYDHSWVERTFTKDADLRGVIDGHSYSDDYIDKVIQKASADQIESANTFIMADVEEFSSPRSVEADAYRIWYLGKYECRV